MQQAEVVIRIHRVICIGRTWSRPSAERRRLRCRDSRHSGRGESIVASIARYRRFAREERACIQYCRFERGLSWIWTESADRMRTVPLNNLPSW